MPPLWRKLGKAPLKERIYQALKVLNAQHRRLQQLVARLHERDKELFNSCAMAKAWGDELHAVLYANELAELRKLTKTVMASSLAIEQVILRLETIEQLGDAMVQLGPVVKIIQSLRGQLTNIIPEVALELDNVNKMLGSILIEVGEPKEAEIVASEEAMKVLKEAEVVAEQRLREKLPELPTPAAEKLPVVVSSSVPAEKIKEGLEEKLLDYIKKHGGELMISKCATDLNTTPQEIRRALDKLASEGKIKTI
ncbi:MAG: Snf7 family protein [Candidatus Nezhaarchaeota archaeon]|nr:Snf7 family protein [Candidatus Nezhaarchaeota archaeon]MCX8141440.1 Snf7 family protein [Candidatus Nezhaarchaeota archaeon]MDW8049706.1 Snf7 family protein [Nitrososphaerota archaeon]